jgi:hypothetical protein
MKISEKIPKTLEEAVNSLFNSIDKNDIKAIEKEKLTFSSLHHSLGRQIRNDWSLWGNSILSKHFKDRFGLGHADDMSGIILKMLDCKYFNQDFGLAKEVEFYHSYWVKQGIDPLTQKPIV